MSNCYWGGHANRAASRDDEENLKAETLLLVEEESPPAESVWPVAQIILAFYLDFLRRKIWGEEGAEVLCLREKREGSGENNNLLWMRKKALHILFFQTQMLKATDVAYGQKLSE